MDSALKRIFNGMLPLAGKGNGLAWQCMPVKSGKSHNEVIRSLDPGFQLKRDAMRWAFFSEHCGRLNVHALWWADELSVLTFLRFAEELTKLSTELIGKNIGSEPPSSTFEIGGLLRYSTWTGGLLDWMVREFITGRIPRSVQSYIQVNLSGESECESPQPSFLTLGLLDTVLRMKDRFGKPETIPTKLMQEVSAKPIDRAKHDRNDWLLTQRGMDHKPKMSELDLSKALDVACATHVDWVHIEPRTIASALREAYKRKTAKPWPFDGRGRKKVKPKS